MTILFALVRKSPTFCTHMRARKYQFCKQVFRKKAIFGPILNNKIYCNTMIKFSTIWKTVCIAYCHIQCAPILFRDATF